MKHRSAAAPGVLDGGARSDGTNRRVAICGPWQTFGQRSPSGSRGGTCAYRWGGVVLVSVLGPFGPAPTVQRVASRASSPAARAPAYGGKSESPRPSALVAPSARPSALVAPSARPLHSPNLTLSPPSPRRRAHVMITGSVQRSHPGLPLDRTSLPVPVSMTMSALPLVVASTQTGLSTTPRATRSCY